jgi:hypothetical protein
MKKILSILSFVALFATVSFSQAKMTFDNTTVDYGEIMQGSEPLRIFNFKNTGNEPLIISNAKGSCGCTVPSYPKEPILPGESAKIEVRYDTNRIGPFQKTVTLTTNEAAGTQTLTIKGTVKAKPTEDSVPASNQGFGN